MLYTRQKELLYIISRLGSAGKTQLQKLEFLSCMNCDKPTYGFFPYKFGPYSLILQKDLDYLSANGYLDHSDDHYTCSVAEHAIADKARCDVINVTLKRFQGYSATGLMAYLYRAYPYYAINSEKAEELLSAEEMQHVQSMVPDTEVPHLFTIGYEGRSIDEYLNILIQNGVRMLIDVRANGISMKPEFSSKRLAGYCNLVGIEYKHHPAIGIASEKRKGFYNKAMLFKDYRKELREDKADELISLYNDVLSGKRVAFTCFERLPSQCHRHVLVDELVLKFGIKLGVEHL